MKRLNSCLYLFHSLVFFFKLIVSRAEQSEASPHLRDLFFRYSVGLSTNKKLAYYEMAVEKSFFSSTDTPIFIYSAININRLTPQSTGLAVTFLVLCFSDV